MWCAVCAALVVRVITGARQSGLANWLIDFSEQLFFLTMTAPLHDEKPAVDQRSVEDVDHVKRSSSLKEKDAENPTASYIPQSDEEYNVTMKTWCVVMVNSILVVTAILSHAYQWLDSLTLLWHQFLDCSCHQCLSDGYCDSTWRPECCCFLCLVIHG